MAQLLISKGDSLLQSVNHYQVNYISQYICMYVPVFTGMYVCTGIYRYLPVCMYVCMYVRTYVRTYVRMYVCMYVCVYLSISISISIYYVYGTFNVYGIKVFIMIFQGNHVECDGESPCRKDDYSRRKMPLTSPAAIEALKKAIMSTQIYRYANDYVRVCNLLKVLWCNVKRY